MDREHPGVPHSPATDDSDGDSLEDAQIKGETNYSAADQMSQAGAVDMQSAYVKGELGTYSGNPSQYRHMAMPHAQSLPSNDYYSHSRASTPSVVNWSGMQQSHRPGQFSSRNSRLPLQLKTFNGLPYTDVGPMTAPVIASEQQYHGQQSVPQSATYMPQEYTSGYYQGMTSAPGSVSYNSATMGAIHPPMLPSIHETHSDAQRVLQAQAKAEQMVSPSQAQSTMPQTPEIYAYGTQDYQEPVNLGVTTDYSNTYQLPVSDMQGWGIADADKYTETFGEPTPGQLASHYAF